MECSAHARVLFNVLENRVINFRHKGQGLLVLIRKKRKEQRESYLSLYKPIGFRFQAPEDMF